nr:tigger transposable element-derived protein 4-like [Parasteatoda tepidariorum]
MEIFKDWLISFDNKITNQGRKVVLFMDNAPCHSFYENLKSVKLQFLPPNTTSEIQPLDQGVIRCFKLEYRRFVLRRLLSLIDCDKNSSQIIQSITVLDAIRWIRHAWENVKGQTIVNCFKKCELSNTALEATIDAADLENEVVELSKAAAIQYDPNSDKYENGLECYDDLSEDWEKRFIDDLDTGVQSDSDNENESPVPYLSNQETLIEQLKKLNNWITPHKRRKAAEILS